MTVPEILVVDPEPGWTAPGPVVASAPPRVVVVQAAVESLDEVAAHARLALIRHPDGRTEARGDERVVDSLDTGARLFVGGWRSRPVDKADRPGDGLSWDAPGFQPPDRPAG